MQIRERDLKAHLRCFRRRDPDSEVFAVHFEGRLMVDEVELDGETWRFREAPSDLAMRTILVGDEKPVVMLTPLRNSTVEKDVKGRLGAGEILNFDVWQPLGMLFEATGVDGRLKSGEHGAAIARILLRIAGAEGVPPVVGHLDEDTAWGVIQRQGLGQDPVAVEPSDWLVWAATSPGPVKELFGRYGEIVPALRQRLERRFGATGRYMMARMEKRDGGEKGVSPGVRMLATGLALDAARAAAQAGEGGDIPVRIKVKLEEGGEAPEDFARESRAAWERLASQTDQARRCDAVRQELDKLLRRHSGESFEVIAAHSAVSEAGWRGRRRRLVRAIEEMLEEGPSAVSDVRQALDELRGHTTAAQRPKRLELLEVLAALAYRLVADGEEPEGLAELGHHYVRDGSFIDAAREKLTSADLGADVAAVRQSVIDRALERSEAQNERFADLLADELRDRDSPRQGLGVQQVLGDVVAPIAQEHPVLMLVLDGLNWAVARWLLFDGALEKWERWAPAGDEGYRPMYATVPSVTKYSRTSLLTGKLQSGEQGLERQGFKRALRDAGGVDYLREATLFHKDGLDADGRGQVGGEVKEAILDREQRVVGVVVNAIDDQLSGAEQVDLDWSVDAVTPLRTLLELGRNRVVVVVGDHGHVWETKTDYAKAGGESARWRGQATEHIDGERVFSGPMIEELSGEPELLAAWSERVRYTRGSRGYHGGASMQEVLTPLIALVRGSREVDLDGFRALNPERPAWWELRQAPDLVEVGGEDVEPSSQLSLIDDGRDLDTRWIEELVATSRFEERMERYGRGVTVDFVAHMLGQLAANEGKLGLSELADLSDVPLRRLTHRIVVLRDVLNREGYQGVRYNRLEGLVELDRAMLERQFGLAQR